MEKKINSSDSSNKFRNRVTKKKLDDTEEKIQKSISKDNDKEKQMEIDFQEEMKKIEELHKKEKERWMLALANEQNKNKAHEIDKEKIRKFSNTNLLKEITETNENLLKAIDSTNKDSLKENSDIANLYQGVKMTQNALESFLKSHGVTRIVPELGSAFDPTMHQAMSVMESKEYENDKIVSSIRACYTIHDRVLIPALVVVSKKVEDK